MRTVITMGKSHNDCFQGKLAEVIPYHRMNGKEYCVPNFIAYDSEELQQLRVASEAVHRIYWKVLRFTQRFMPDEFIEQYLGVDPALIPLARKETPSHGIARLDWIINEQGIKCIENNCDTPTGVPEVAFAANEMLGQLVEGTVVAGVGAGTEARTAVETGEEIGVGAGAEARTVVRTAAEPVIRAEARTAAELATTRASWAEEQALTSQTEGDPSSKSADTSKRHDSSAYTCSYMSTSSEMNDQIGDAFAKLIEHYRQQGACGLIVFTSFDWHAEDRANTEYIMACLQSKGYQARYVPLAELELIPNVGLYANGERISILYRLYPLEYIVHDVDETGARSIGLDLLQLVEQGKLYLINPEQSILMQSKGFMALIWSLYERRAETEQYCGFTPLDDEDVRNIERYLLPTYFEDSVFVQQQLPYVAKGIWGREGKGTAIHEADGQRQSEPDEFSKQPIARKAADIAATAASAEGLVDITADQEAEDAAELDYYNGQRKIYQQYYPLQRVQIDTEDGAYSGYLLTGAFLVDGKFSGLLPRVGEKVTGDMAYFCPAVITV